MYKKSTVVHKMYVHTQQSYGNMRHLYRTVIRRAVIAISLLCLLVFVCLQNLMTVTVFNSSL